jgi:pimeloyl-ACP methyl ester carboxylesterase
MTTHTVSGGGGIDIHVDERGNEDGRPILFVHGYSVTRLAWDAQMHSDLGDDFRLVALDNRGHGWSDKPEDAYDDAELWAEDLHAVIDTLELDDPVLVGASYGGLTVTDYLSVYGDDAVAGVNLVGGITKIGTEDAMAVIGEAFVEFLPAFESTDVGESVGGIREFIPRMRYTPLSPQEHYYWLGFMASVPPHVRVGLHSRSVTYDDLLPGIESPVLLSHGEEDEIVLPEAAEEHADRFSNARISLYPEVGHLPSWENPDRFNRELREFVDGL